MPIWRLRTVSTGASNAPPVERRANGEFARRRAVRDRPDSTLFQRVQSISLVVPMILVVVACGPIGDDDGEATATSVPAPSQPTPLVPVPASPVATIAAATPLGTPPATPMASPIASPVATDSSGGAPPASPVATPVSTPEAATVSLPIARNCAPPAPLPEPEVQGPLVITDDAVNLRDGPGTTCGVIEQLASGDDVVPLSGAVLADELSWILVNADGTEGWVATDFLAPTT